MLEVSKTASYEITCLSVPLSSVGLFVWLFYQDWIISFFLILYMMIADHDILWLMEPNILAAQISAKWANNGLEASFFAIFSSLVH